MACHQFAAANVEEFPFAQKYDIWDTYCWSELILPYIEQKAVFDGYWNLHSSGYNPALDPPYPSPNGPIGDDVRLRQSPHDAHFHILLPKRHPHAPGKSVGRRD